MKHLPNLLIVDDSEQNLDLLENVINKLRVNLVRALSGVEALEKTRGMALALAIIDVRMPDMNGYELALKMNERRKGNKVPIIFITASHMNETEVFKGYGSGAVDYLFKPFDNHVLLSKINVFLDLFNHQQTIIRDAVQLKKISDELALANVTLKQSEEKYRSYVDHAPEGVFIADETGRYIEVNQAACIMTGYSKKELLQMSISDILPQESLNDGLSHFGKLIQKGIAKSDMMFRHKGGSNRWWTVDAVKLSESRFLGFAKDITHRKVLEESLRQHHTELEMQNEELSVAIYEAKVASEKYTELYDFAPTGYFTLSTDFKILELNHTGACLLGKDRSRLIDCHFGHFVSISSLPVFQEFFMKVFQSDTKEVCEVLLETDDKQSKYVHIEGVALKNGTQYLLNVVDITDRKKAEEDLRASKSNLEEAQRIARMGSWDWDMGSGLVTWSNEIYRIFDVTPAEFDGKPESLIKVIHPEDVDYFIECMKTNIANGSAPSLEYRIIHKDGSVHNILAEGKIEFDSKGIPVRNFGTIQDITERKASETNILEKEKEIRAVLNSSPEAIFLLDEHGTLLLANEELGNRFGFKSENMIGSNLYDIIPPEVKNFRKPIIESVFRSGKPVRFEDVRTGRHILNSIYPIFDKNGKVTSVAIYASDITDRTISEKTLKESERLYRTLLNASPDGIFLIDMKGIITEVSEIGIELFGAENRDDLVGKEIFRFVPSDEKNTLKEIIEKTTNEGLVQNIGIKVRRKNQTLFASETSATLIQGPDGAPIAFMIIVRDISHRKKMETKQIHADRMANLGEMASGIAHEINQPLNIISMVMDKILFESAKTDTVSVDFLKIKSDKIFENITRIRNIIDHIRAFSRSHDDYVLTDFDINKSIENAASMITEQFKHLGINLILQLEPKIPHLCGNTYKFEQVIINLLTNAKDAVIEKKNKYEAPFEMIIGIRSYQENHSLIVELTDNGIGIGNDDINNIILPFYTTKDEGKGTGLGLSICYQIIKEMDGTIAITSEKLNGTIVRLTLNIQEKK
ncbi:MAG: PAS domain S-box protein [Bacteroidota bacterium]